MQQHCCPHKRAALEGQWLGRSCSRAVRLTVLTNLMTRAHSMWTNITHSARPCSVRYCTRGSFMRDHMHGHMHRHNRTAIFWLCACMHEYTYVEMCACTTMSTYRQTIMCMRTNA